MTDLQPLLTLTSNKQNGFECNDNNLIFLTFTATIKA